MNRFEPHGPWLRNTKLGAAARVLMPVAVAGACAAAWLTAGPGNYHALQLANARVHPQAIHVTLPTVVVVGQRERAEPVKVASSAALSAGNAGVNPFDPAAIRVNLNQ